MSKKVAKWGIIGVIAGAIAGVLFAPKSGKETREDIKEGVSKARSEAEERLRSIYGDLQKKAKDARARAGQMTGEAKTELDDVVEASKPLMDKLKEIISSLSRGDKVSDEEIDKAMDEAKKTSKKMKK